MEKTPFESTLTALNLSTEQVSLYTSLLKTGPQTAVQLAKNSSVKRTYVYKLAEQMIGQGLIRQEVKGRTTTFIAESPDKLLDLAAALKTKAEQTTANLENILPSLKSLFAATNNKPIVTYFEGIEGFKKIHLTILAEKMEILAYVRVDSLLDAPLTDFWPKYYKIRQENHIRVRAICPNNKEGKSYQKHDNEELRKTLLVPQEIFPITIEKNIVGNKVAFFFREENHMIAMLIESQEIADTERKIFELAWKTALTHQHR